MMFDFKFSFNLFLRQPLVTEVAAFGEIPSNIHRLTQQPPVTCVPVNVAPTSHPSPPRPAPCPPTCSPPRPAPRSPPCSRGKSKFH